MPPLNGRVWPYPKAGHCCRDGRIPAVPGVRQSLPHPTRTRQCEEALEHQVELSGQLNELRHAGSEKASTGRNPRGVSWALNCPRWGRGRSQQCLPPSLGLLRQRVSVSLERRGGAPSGLRRRRAPPGWRSRGNLPKLLLLPPQRHLRRRLLQLKDSHRVCALPCWDVPTISNPIF